MLDEGQDEQQASETLNAALQQLTQLTSLMMSGMCAVGGLPALAGLARLQRGCFTACRGLDSLPDGAWCHSLRELGSSWDCLQSSQQLLAAAAQLQCVVVLGSSSRITAWLLQWAAKHPPLRQLQLHIGGQVPAGLLGALPHLKQERPQLEVTHERQGWRATDFEQKFQVNWHFN